MSLHHFEQHSEYRYGIWKMEEEEDALVRLSGCAPPPHITNPGRRAEFLSVRALAKSMGVDPLSIKYHASGKPFLSDSTETISITHTKRYVAVLLSSLPQAAIDMETRSQRVLRIRHKFMHPDEERHLKQSGMEETIGLLLHWCVKEAVFKSIPDEGMDFAKDIRIMPFQYSGKTERVSAKSLRENISFLVDYRIEADFVLSCCFSIN